MIKKYYIGAMSGTSFDAIDVSVIRIQDGISLEFFHSKKIPSQIKSKIRSLINKEIFTLSELGKLDKQIGSLFSSSIKECIYKISNEKLPFIFKNNCIVTPFNLQDSSVISWLKFNRIILSFKSYLHTFEDYKLVYLIQNK